MKIAIWLMLYTAVRTIEIRHAKWQDFRLPENLWHIPAHKMKKRRDHLVPLSTQAMKLLEELHMISGNGKLLFPNSKRLDDMISATTINRALEYMGMAFTAHDFHATASTHLNEIGFDERYIEMQLAPRRHTLNPSRLSLRCADGWTLRTIHTGNGVPNVLKRTQFCDSKPPAPNAARGSLKYGLPVAGLMGAKSFSVSLSNTNPNRSPYNSKVLLVLNLSSQRSVIAPSLVSLMG